MNERANKLNIPETGISGVYEVIYATPDLEKAIRYFNEFGFQKVKTGSLDAKHSHKLYNHKAELSSVRMQNGKIDSHGLIRIVKWSQFKNKGVGFAPPRSIGQRLSVMRTNDIYRIKDVFDIEKENGNSWLATNPVTDDLFDLNNNKSDFYSRPTVVKENAVYGEFFNHIFFQRYGYHIEGYGSISNESPLKTSEFTHHDFFVNCQDISQMNYLSFALGLKAEDPPKIDTADLEGPKAVFQMKSGEGHWYQGFVSPNNICGKLKFFIPTAATKDLSDKQIVGAQGITQHSFYVENLSYVHCLLINHDLDPSCIMENEFGESCFNFKGPGGCNWQILANIQVKNKPLTTLKVTKVNN